MKNKYKRRNLLQFLKFGTLETNLQCRAAAKMGDLISVRVDQRLRRSHRSLDHAGKDRG